ncbi:MAG TPA: type IV toxin-antitoxin system AbiEi family antitoxin [Usitatibacter sp.]|jgi:hypothetical protein|nr:type IV toxin-antitoxin system AbiEi family antitoxin [Usitatibacter sp.]
MENRAKKQGLDDAALLDAAANVLRDYGVHVVAEKAPKRLGNKAADALIRIGGDDGETLLAVDLKRAPDDAALAPVLGAADRDKTLVVADFIAPRLAEKLRARNVPYVDVAGNAWLRGPRYLVWVEGRRPVIRTAKPPVARAFAAGGLRLIFALLTNPEWVQLPTRTLAAYAGIANGTAAAALADLEAQGFVVGKRAGKRRFRNRELLLNKWTEGYLQRLQPTLLLGVYRAPDAGPNWWANAADENGNLLLGAEPAAAEVTQFLTPGQITFYVEGNAADLQMRYRLRKTADGDVIVRRKFWNFVTPDWHFAKTVPPLLIYADLIGTHDARCIETANRIKEEHLAGLLRN